MLFLRIASLSVGRSGIREEVLHLLLELLNAGLLPVVPSQGSLGASGDLAPLAHLALPLIGEGQCRESSGTVITGAEALARIAREPMELQAKEGLALINGTQGMTAILSLALLDGRRVADAADCAAAMGVEALLGTSRAFDEGLIRLRPHPGAELVASNLRLLTRNSRIVESHTRCDKVQDAYSLRCVPQVHGATRDAMEYVSTTLGRELCSVTDNPLLLPDGSIVSGGNFHGQPVALAADHLALAVAELGSISERRLERLLNPDLSGLPAFLAPAPGLNSGLMIAQYTAASLVSENKVLVHPASADSISVSGSQEDHVSMGMTAARQCSEVVRNTRTVVATELIAACQAFHLLDLGEQPGEGVVECLRLVREVVPPLERDRDITGDLEAVRDLIDRGEFSSVLERLAAKS
jgi:histidine ammonia-lyase